MEIEIECPEGVKPMRGLGRDIQINGRRASFRLNQIGAKQERYIVVELEVAPGLAQGQAAIADVTVSYADAKTKARAKLSAKAEVKFSALPEEVSRSANANVSASVATQLANEQSEAAVKARDSGNVAEAKRRLEQNAANLRDQATRAAPAAPGRGRKAAGARGKERSRRESGWRPRLGSPAQIHDRRSIPQQNPAGVLSKV